MRYEDNITNEIPFSVGIIISSLSIESCDEQWCPGYRCWSDTDSYSFQLMQLSGLSVYFDKLSNSKFWNAANLDSVS